RLNELSDALLALEEPLKAAADPMAALVENVAAAARIQARSLQPILEQTGALSASAASDVESSRSALLGSLASLRDQLHQLVGERSQAAAKAPLESALRAGWRSAHDLAVRIRDESARHADALDRLGRSEAGLVMRILESTDAVLILS